MRSPIDTYLDLSQTDDLLPLSQASYDQDLWDETIGWQPSAAQVMQFERLYHSVLQGNRAFNLTRITEPEEFWEKHIWDSLSGIRAFLNAEAENAEAVADEEGEGGLEQPAGSASGEIEDAHSRDDESPLGGLPLRVIDVGTGGGFPGLPVAIACPNWHLTLLDSTRKKTTFLEAAIRALQIPNACPVTDRVEALGRHPDHREHYDLVLLRAVAPVTVCAEYALPLLKVDGWAVLYRGRWTEAEADALLAALDLLGGEIDFIDSFQTPMSGGDRHCVILKKVRPTPSDFPRSVGVPTKDPL